MKTRYSRRGLLALFLSCAFLVHLWAFVLIFKDFSMLIGRTSLWGAVGVMSYGLLFALIESVFVFLVAAVLGFLVSTRWDEPQRVALLGTLAMLATFWIMLSQVWMMWDYQSPGQSALFILQSQHPLRWLFVWTGILLAGVVVSLLAPALLILRSRGFFNFIQAVLDRTGFLTGFYLFLDALAFIVVLVRNV